MDRFVFSAAGAVFADASTAEQDRRQNAVAHYGFHHAFSCERIEQAVVRITARNIYRLYVNGKMVMHGPARTAHGYARVDVIPIEQYLAEGENHIAVEVVAYSGAFVKEYSNDCTLEPGLLTAEVEADGRILSATGRDGWQVCRLQEREGRAERVSHSRECSEICRLLPNRTAWRPGMNDDFEAAVKLGTEPIYLSRKSPLPNLEKHSARDIVGFGACRMDDQIKVLPEFWNQDAFNPEGYYASLSVHAVEDCHRTIEDEGCEPIMVRRNACGGILLEGVSDKYIAFDMGENQVGFPGVEISAEKAGVVDILHTESLELDGSFAYPHNIVTRLYIPAGRTYFVAMEPCIARYLKLYLRGTGNVTLHETFMHEYTIPDTHRSAFLCSDGEINRLYAAAKRTLILNTLDIFMDCPDRERGGWLCDSLWTARAASMLLSDNRVERDFIENFLLTPAEGMSNAFFPDVYPGNKQNFSEGTGISTWSFWLMCELCEYVRRTGDREFAMEHEKRVEAFVNGSSRFIGKSGLIEKLDGMFFDWSLSNRREYQSDVSTPANALYAFLLCELGELYYRPEWIQRGEAMRGILRNVIIGSVSGGLKNLKIFPDGWEIEADGSLSGCGCTSESGMATALWSGLFTAEEAPALMRNVRDSMGPAPRFPSDPNIGKSGLFIGLCIRMDMLCRMGMHGQMFEDMKAIYLPQLKEGPGTLWEHSVIDSSSRCHGFNGHAGVHLLRDVLGMGMPERRADGTVRLIIAPHLCGLRWAKGSVELPEGVMAVDWKCDGDSFELNVHLPAENREKFRVDVILPREARAMDNENVRVRIC